MAKKLRKSLWGLQWIFLRDENKMPSLKTTSMLDFAISQIEDVVDSDIDDLPLMPRARGNASMSKVSSIKSSYKLSHINDKTYKDFRSANVQLEESVEEPFKIPRKITKRPGTVEIRRLKLPPKTMPRPRVKEPDTCFNRRKNYGKWYLPPETWKDYKQYM